MARLFASEEEHRELHREAVLKEAYARLLDVALAPAAAFALLDRDGDGEVRPEDFGGASAQHLGLPPSLLVRLFEAVDADGRGVVSLAAWTAAFDASREARPAGPGWEPSLGSEPIPPPEAVPLEVLRRFTLELVNHSTYAQVWSSEGTQCRKHASIWAPDQLVQGLMRVTALRFSLGHYANQGFADARGGGSAGVQRRLILQVRDKRAFRASSSQEYLEAVADHYCPYPAKFRQVWNQKRGRQQLYVWRPVPPSEAFVALGMVATTTPDPPPVEKVRCVPKSFCRPATQAPVSLWDDSGSGGRPASIWLVNAAQVLWAVAGHAPPQEKVFWELASDSISFDYNGRPSVHIVHERTSSTSAPPTPAKTAGSLLQMFSRS